MLDRQIPHVAGALVCSGFNVCIGREEARKCSEALKGSTANTLQISAEPILAALVLEIGSGFATPELWIALVRIDFGYSTAPVA